MWCSPTAIELSFRDEMGRPRKMKADGLMARCIQHEMDHLNGVLFVDRVTDEDGLQKELKDQGFERQACAERRPESMPMKPLAGRVPGPRLCIWVSPAPDVCLNWPTAIPISGSKPPAGSWPWRPLEPWGPFCSPFA